MTTIKSNNPAGRLYLVLTRLKDGGNLNTSMNDVIAQKFELEKNDFPQISRIFVSIINLATEAIEAVEQLGLDDPELYSEPLERIRRGFSRYGLDQHLKNYVDQYMTPVILSQLEFVSSRLSSSFLSENEIEEDEIDGLLKQTEVLLEELRISTIQQSLKTLLLRRVKDIHQALTDYKQGLTGVNSLIDVYEHSIGTVFVNYILIENSITNDEEAKNIVNKLRSILSGLGKITGTVVAKELAEWAIDNAPALLEAINK